MHKNSVMLETKGLEKITCLTMVLTEMSGYPRKGGKKGREGGCL